MNKLSNPWINHNLGIDNLMIQTIDIVFQNDWSKQQKCFIEYDIITFYYLYYGWEWYVYAGLFYYLYIWDIKCFDQIIYSKEPN